MRTSVKYTVAVFLILVIFMGCIAYWQSLNRAYFDYDSLRHYLFTLRLADDYKSGPHGLLPRASAYLNLAKHPPGAYIVNSLLYLFISPTQRNAVLVNDAIFLTILLLSLFKLGKLIQDERLGLLSCAIMLLYPVVFNQAKVYMLDLPLSALTVLNIYLLIKSGYFSNKAYTIFYMVSFFCGLMIKPNFLFFTAGPLAYAAFKNRKEKIVNLATLSALIAGVFFVYFLASPLYDKSVFKDFFTGWMGSFQVTTWTPHELLDAPFLVHRIRAFSWYIWGFINWQAGFLFFVLFLWGLITFIKSDNTHKKIIALWLFSSYFLLSWFLYGIDFDMEVTAVRYSMPVLGAIAVISSYGISNVRRIFLRRLVVIAVLAFGLMNFVFLSHPVLKKPLRLKIDIPQDRYHILPSYINIYSTEPLIISGTGWKSHPQDRGRIYKDIEEAFFFINSFYEKDRIKVLVLSDDAKWRHLKYLAYMNNKDIIFFCDYSRLIYFHFFKGMTKRMMPLAKKADFVIEVKDGFTEPHLKRLDSVLRGLFEEERHKFNLVKEGMSFKIYRRAAP